MTPQLLNLLQQNRMEEAHTVCAELCRLHPGNAQTQFMMSAISGQLGNFAESEKYALKAVKLNPNVPEAHVNLGIAQLRLHKLDNALQSLKRALKLRPDFPEACQGLANAYQCLGEHDKAIKLYHRAIELRPNYAEALCNLGGTQIKTGNLPQAADSLKAALAINPRLPEAHTHLAMIAQQEDRAVEAEQHLQQANALAPGHPEANLALGELLADKDPPSARAHCETAAASAENDPAFLARVASLYKRLDQTDASLDFYRRAQKASPKDPHIITSLGVALKEAGRLDESIRLHRKALNINPNFAEAHYNLAIAYNAADQLENAEESYCRSIELKPELAEAWTNLGSLLLVQGRTEESIASFQHALDASPGYLPAASNRLFALNYPGDLSPEEIYEEHRQWGESFLDRQPRAAFEHSDRTSNTLLRLGFVSGDFHHHSVAYFFASLLDHNDVAIEIHCYSNTLRIDATTEDIRNQVAGWRDITRLNDIEAARLIHDDKIDVLIDLAGHTSGHRLGIFALRPCQTQITYLGYPNTTGLASIDYRITDVISDPQDNDAFYTEILLRLDRCFLCYAPPLDAPPPTPTGHDTSRPITFGSFNNLAKVTPEVIRVWSEILKQSPDSILVIKSRPLADKSVANRILSQFNEQGIPPERLQLLPWIFGIGNHLEIYNRIDIALDTFPYNGTTTTCEALWMERPVVALCGQTHASRVSASLLNTVNMNELIAEDKQTYINIAVGLANDITRFREKHPNLRETVKNSSLCDRSDFQKKIFDLVCSAVKMSNQHI